MKDSAPTHAARFALLLLVAYALVATGMAPWPPLAVVVALLGLLLLPGAAVLIWFETPAENGWFEFLARAAVTGLTAQAAALWLAAALGEPFFFAAVWLPVGGAALLLVHTFLRSRRAAAGAVARPSDPVATILLLAILAAVAWVGAMGPPFEVTSDSLDHVATIRRAALTGDPFPRDAFYLDPGLAGADPRKGLYHGVLALAVRVSGLDPLTVWRWAPLVFAPLLAVGVFALARAVTGRRRIGVLAAGFALVLHGGGEPLLAWREAVYSTRVSEAAGFLA